MPLDPRCKTGGTDKDDGAASMEGRVVDGSVKMVPELMRNHSAELRERNHDVKRVEASGGALRSALPLGGCIRSFHRELLEYSLRQNSTGITRSGTPSYPRNL
jgi:hypothetical protein